MDAIDALVEARETAIAAAETAIAAAVTAARLPLLAQIDQQHFDLFVERDRNAALELQVGNLLREADTLRAEVASLQPPPPLTRGGEGYEIMRPGTLPDLLAALNGGDRVIQPTLTGDVVMTAQRYLGGSNVTLDFGGRFRLVGYGLGIWGKHDVIVRGLRVVDAGVGASSVYDGLQIARDKNLSTQPRSQRILVERCVIEGATDGAIDVSDADDVEVRDCVLSATAFVFGLNRALGVRAHHNLLVGCQNRQPEVGWASPTPPAAGCMMDFRANVVWGITAYGAVLNPGSRVNLVDNVWFHTGSSRPALAENVFVVYPGATLYARGNVSVNGFDLDALSTVSEPV